MTELPGPRRRTIERGLFTKPAAIAGIEPDAFVGLCGVCSLILFLSRFRPLFIAMAAAIFVAGLIGFTLLYRSEPRFFKKYRGYRIWHGAFRAKPPMIAAARKRKKKTKKAAA